MRGWSKLYVAPHLDTPRISRNIPRSRRRYQRAAARRRALVANAERPGPQHARRAGRLGQSRHRDRHGAHPASARAGSSLSLDWPCRRVTPMPVLGAAPEPIRSRDRVPQSIRTLASTQPDLRKSPASSALMPAGKLIYSASIVVGLKRRATIPTLPSKSATRC